MNNNDLPIERILSQIDNASFYPSNGLNIRKRSGKSWECDCPFCGKPKHFSLDPVTGMWKCWKCEESGNQISFLAKVKGYSNGDAVREIKEGLGLVDSMETRPAGPRRGSKKKDAKPKMQTVPPPPGDGDAPPGGADVKVGGSPPPKQPEAKERPSVVPHGPIQEVYQRLTDLLPLTPEHRAELKQKRGFTDAIIDELKFRSGGKHVAKVIEQLREEMGDGRLAEAKVLLMVNGKLQVNYQLTDGRVLIPYLDVDGRVYHFRPHKDGFEDVPVQPYGSNFLKDNPPMVVLAESEFKATALYQWGIAALGIPGTSSFSIKNYDRLVNILRAFGAKQVPIVFDNEIKDNKDFPNFKQQIEKRYDTQSWAIIMAKKLGADGFATSIGTLPAEWMENGKIDFDMALAQGRTREQIMSVIRNALPVKEYESGLEDAARKIVRQKVSRHFAQLKSKIEREFNRYVIHRKDFDETVSNFVINIKASYYTADGVIRQVQFVNEFGDHSDTFMLSPGDMAGLNSFKEFCFAKGNYVFEGSTNDLTDIWKFEFLRDSGQLIYMPEKIGRLDNDIWLFGNMAIKDGTIYNPDNDGIIWIDGKGYKPQSLRFGMRDEPMEDAIPSIKSDEVNIQEIAERMRHCVGGYEAYIGIGWIIATIFSKDIFAKYKCMPFLFPNGKRESGKSSFMRWLIRMAGVESDGISLPESSQNYIMRTLAYYASLPVWYDEYRNDPKVTQKDGYLRSAYNRQLSGKGMKQGFGTRGYEVVGTVAIAGEVTPKDSGLFTRCVILQISANKRDRLYYDWLNNEMGKFSGLAFHLIMNYDKYKDKILNNIADLKKALVRLKIPDRTAENWGMLAGSFEAVVLEDDQFIKWVEMSCQQIKIAGEEEHMLNVFWEETSVMQSDGTVNSKHLKAETVGGRDILYIWFTGLHDLWMQHYRKKTGNEPFNKNTIASYIRDEPYFLNDDVSKRFGGDKHRAISIDVEKATETIKEIAFLAKEKYQNMPDL